ncbi:hypothetical protein ABGB12_30450 [Actinocorallia sp. B10E7]|uniref:hypothetical protein n=1 Tax=Actinocorallia sp. B10E7 TaxID=3153558 RepID=UPI00325E5369
MIDGPGPLAALARLHRPKRRIAGVHGQGESDIYGICVHRTDLVGTADPNDNYEAAAYREPVERHPPRIY